MDVLKSFAKNDDDLGEQNNVKRFSEDIRTQFELEKCAKDTFKKGYLVKYKTLH